MFFAAQTKSISQPGNEEGEMGEGVPRTASVPCSALASYGSSREQPLSKVVFKVSARVQTSGHHDD